MDAYCTCSSKDHGICPACQLFGVINDKLLIRSRIRVSDALPVRPITGELKKVTMPILSAPKPSAYEFYINRPVIGGKPADFWNYDFYALSAKNGASFQQRNDFTPRGRKFYWHGKEQTTNERSDQNATLEVMPKGTAFTFKVYFDRITEKQLTELQWLITLGENKADSTLQHKLGHGKPVGYGSVKLIIRDTTVRKLIQAEGNISY